MQPMQGSVPISQIGAFASRLDDDPEQDARVRYSNSPACNVVDTPRAAWGSSHVWSPSWIAFPQGSGVANRAPTLCLHHCAKGSTRAKLDSCIRE